MQCIFSVVMPSGATQDVEYIGGAGTTIADLRRALAALLLQEVRFLALHDVPMADDRTVGSCGIRNGSRVFLDRLGPPAAPGSGVLVLAVSRGLDSGRTDIARPGRIVVGRDHSADMQIIDPDLSRRHAEIVVAAHSITIRDLGSTNGTMVNGEDIGTEEKLVVPGDRIAFGNAVLELTTMTSPPLSTRARDDGLVSVNRPPRMGIIAPPRLVDFPVLPSPLARHRVQWIAALLPAVLAAALALAMHNLQFLAFAALGPLTMIGTAMADRISGGRDNRRRGKQFRTEEGEAQSRLSAALDAECHERAERFPDAATLGSAAAALDAVLWRRRRGDDDFLHVRLGTADLPSWTRGQRDAQRSPASILTALPVTVDLRRGPLGICGPAVAQQSLTGFVVAQLAILHSPADVAIHLLTDDEESHWNWLRWMKGEGAAMRQVSTSAQEHSLHIRALLDDARQRKTDPLHADWQGPWSVLVVDSPSCLALPEFAELLGEFGTVGVTAVVTTESTSHLPSACSAVLQLGGGHGESFTLHADSGDDPLSARTDGVGAPWLDRVGRSLSPLRDVAGSASSGIPARVALSDVLPFPTLDARTIVEHWRSADTVRVPVGVGASGPVWLDLDSDGPHCLIAGTTGAGKSELLRSLITGLALAQPPDRLSFVFIDYKGGAAFADSVGLPHTLAMVTDLDAHLTRRALDSLGAELTRREEVFARLGVADLREYRRLDPSDEKPLPRLMIVVDEFASLADELPDFLDGLVSIAQRGRSLGVHLVLATQRPAGVVSPEIKANMALRIALRVTDTGESLDVVGDARAAAIPKNRPGRAVGLTAAGLVDFQTAQVSETDARASAVQLRRLDAWNVPLPSRHDQRQAGLLDLVRRETARAAVLADIVTPDRPWLEPLPSRLDRRALGGAPTAFGLGDLPIRQSQPSVVLDLDDPTSIAFVGGARSGRTSALRAVLAAAIASPGHRPQLHVIDYGGALATNARGLSLVGTVLGRDDTAELTRFTALLRAQLSSRQARLAALGADSAAAARERGDSMPPVFVLVDGWEALVSATDQLDGGSAVAELLAIARDGASAGISLVVAGDRALLSGRVFSVLPEKYLLAMTDPNDFGMAGLPRTSIPTHMPPGRAVRLRDCLEVQIALVDTVHDVASGAVDDELIVLEPLPSTISLAAVMTQRRRRAIPAQVGQVVLGVGGDAGAAVCVDVLRPPNRFLIAGPSRSGRSTALVTALEGLVHRRHRIAVLAGSRSPVTRWAVGRGVPTVCTDPPLADDGEAAWTLGAQAILDTCEVMAVDDLEALNDSALGDVVSDLLKQRAVTVVATARSDELAMTFRGLGVEMRRHRTGLLLAPTTADGELFGIRVARTNPFGRPERVPPGRGLLITDETRERHPDGLPIQTAMSASNSEIS